MRLDRGLRVYVERTPESFALPAWAALSRCVRHPFGVPDWTAIWWSHFGSDSEPCVLRVQDGTADLAFVPLRRSPDDERVLEFIGGVDLTDYLGPVCDPVDEMDIGAAVGAWLVEGAHGCAAVDFRFLPPGSVFAGSLERKLRANGCKVAIEADGVVARLDLARSWDEQLGLLPSKQRHEVNRKRRRYEKLTGVKPSIRRTDRSSPAADVETFIALHRQSRGRKGQFFVGAVSEFFHDVASCYGQRGELALEFLEVGDQPLAAALSFERDGQKFLYNMAYDVTASRLSPGIVLLSELIRREIDAGSHAFDLLRGDEDYKRRLGARMQPLVRLRAELSGAQARRASPSFRASAA